MKLAKMEDIRPIFFRAINHWDNLNNDSTLNWDYVDADVQMDLNSKGFELNDHVEKCINMLIGAYNDFMKNGL